MLGLMSWRDAGRLVPIRDCHLQDEGANAILRLVAAALRPQAIADAAQSSPAQASTACCQQVQWSASPSMLKVPAKLSGRWKGVQFAEGAL